MATPTPILARNFSNNATPTTLASNVAATDTTVNGVSISNWPTAPFTACIARNTPEQEFLLVNSYVGSGGTASATYAGNNSVNVTRGYNNTTAVAHLAGLTFEHTTGAIDYQEANEHHTDTTRDDHCFTADTEVLTEDGWKLGIDVTEGESVWTFNIDTEEMILEPVAGVYRYSAEKFPNVYSIQNQDMGELRVTAKHTMIIKRRGRAWRRVEAQNLPKQFLMPASGYAAYDGVALSSDEIEILAWAFTEGSWIRDSRGTPIRMVISQNEGPFADCIRKNLSNLGFSWIEQTSNTVSNNTNIAFKTYDIDLFSKYLSYDNTKTPDRSLLKMNHRQFIHFMSVAIMGDGCLSAHHSSQKLQILNEWMEDQGPMPSMVFAQKCKTTIDFLQELCVVNGIKTSIFEDQDQNGNHIWKLNVKQSRYHEILERGDNHQVMLVPNDQDVWCLSVPTNKTLVVRRPTSKSVPVITGNTQYVLVDGGRAITAPLVIDDVTYPGWDPRTFTYSVQGNVSVPSGNSNSLPPFFAPVLTNVTNARLRGAMSVCESGSLTFSLNQNGTAIAGMSGLNVTSTESALLTPTGTITFAQGDLIQPVVTAVSSPQPIGWSLVIWIDVQRLV